MKRLELSMLEKDGPVKEKGFIEVKTADGALSLPVYVIQGRAHPRITIVGAQHSNEYCGSDAIIRLIEDFDKIDPERINGSIVMFPVANVPGYPIRTCCVSQFDGSNLNRSYPGDPQGTECQRIAHVIWSAARTGDYVLDLHGGDISEHIIRYAEMHRAEDQQVNRASLALASCFDLEYVLFSVAGNDYAYPDFRSLYGLAQDSGIPAAIVEAGGAGISDEDSVEYFYEGLKNVFHRFGFLEMPRKPEWIREKRELTATMGVSCIERPAEGRFVSFVSAGDGVEKGQLLGEITDYCGGVLDTIRSPHTGVVSLVQSTRGKNEGDLIYMVLDLERAVKAQA